MSVLRQLARGLRVLTNQTTADRDVTDEVQHYLDETTKEFIARGLSPEEALRASRLQFGNRTVVYEQVRAYGWENRIGTFFSDLRYAVRRLGKTRLLLLLACSPWLWASAPAPQSLAP